jgi:hypothetical protein
MLRWSARSRKTLALNSGKGTGEHLRTFVYQHPEVLVGRLNQQLDIWVPEAIVTRLVDRRRKSLRPLYRQIKKEVGGTSFLPIASSPDDSLEPVTKPP